LANLFVERALRGIPLAEARAVGDALVGEFVKAVSFDSMSMQTIVERNRFRVSCQIYVHDIR